MGIIGSEIKPFNATAFQEGKGFFDVNEADVKGKWAVASPATPARRVSRGWAPKSPG